MKKSLMANYGKGIVRWLYEPQWPYRDTLVIEFHFVILYENEWHFSSIIVIYIKVEKSSFRVDFVDPRWSRGQ